MFTKTKSLLLKTESVLLAAVLMASMLLLAPSTHAAGLADMSDEFDGDLSKWTELSDVENTGPVRYDFLQTENGKMVTELTYASTWYQKYKGPFIFQEVTGDFIAMTHVKVTSKDGTTKPNKAYSLAGLLAKDNADSWLFHAIGEGPGDGGYETEVKTTENAVSELELVSAPADNMHVALIRIGSDFAFLRHFDGAWEVHKRYSRPDLPEELKVGMHFYNDYYATEGMTVDQYVNTDNIPSDGNGLRAEFDYFRFKETGATKTMGGMSNEELIALIESDDAPQPTEPTEPTEPVEPTEPTQPTEPTEPVEPTEPTQPTEPIEPSQPTEPTEPLPTPNVSFPDTQNHWSKPYVEEIAALGIASGYENGLFGVDDEITRDQMSKMTYLALVGNNEPVASGYVFDDVPASHWAAGYIQALKEKGIVTGYGDGKNFGPGDTLTRDQGVVMLLRAINKTPRSNLSNPFSDVPEYWATNSILEAADLGVVSGYAGTDKYGPLDSLLRGQVAKMISILMPMM